MYGIFTFTECGSHATNQDAFAIKVHPDDPLCCVCAVADGQGGRPGGRDAARTACCVTIETALLYSPIQLARPSSWPTILRAVDNGVRGSADAGWGEIVSVITQINGQAMIDSLQHSARLPSSGKFQDDFTVVAVQNQHNNG